MRFLLTLVNGPILMAMGLEITILAVYQMHSLFVRHNGLIPMVTDIPTQIRDGQKTKALMPIQATLHDGPTLTVMDTMMELTTIARVSLEHHSMTEKDVPTKTATDTQTQTQHGLSPAALTLS